MVKRVMVGLLLGACCIAIVAANAAPAKKDATKLYEVTFEAKALSTQAHFLCSVLVKDAITKKTICAPQISTTVDTPASVESKTDDGAKLLIKVSIDKEGKKATCSFVASKGGQEIQKSELTALVK